MLAGLRGGGDPADIDDDDGVIEPDVLAFANEDERLPWLESDDDDVQEGGVDTGRVVAFVIGSLVVLGLIIGAAWWYFRDRDAGTEVADGGTIAAPAGPYKTKPENPGGAEALGTGDTSFRVAEGEEPRSQVAEAGEAPRPSIDRNQPANASAPAASGGIGVQVGAYSSRDSAEAGWSTLSTRYPALSGVSHRIVQGTVDGSPIYRLQAVAGDVKAATALCGAVRGQGGDCQVKN
jgi:hypothetical protein